MPKESLIKIIPEQKMPVSSRTNIILAIAFLIFLASIIVYLVFLYQNNALKGKSQGLDKSIGALESKDNVALRGKLKDTAAKIADFSGLLKNNKYSSQILSFVRSICHAKVQFTKVEWSANTMLLSLAGKTENFKTLGEQWLIVRNNPDIKSATLGSAALDSKTGKVVFSLSTILKDDPLLYGSFPQETIPEIVAPVSSTE
jgi:hypothetical protein